MFIAKEIKLQNELVVTFKVSPGEIIHLTGENGIGKSLLLKSMTRLIPAIWNEMSLHGVETSSFKVEEWRRKIIYLPPEIQCDASMNVEEFFLEPFSFAIYKNFKQVFNPRDYFQDLGKKIGHLSSGQKQEIVLLRALSLDPDILLLDESITHLDSSKRDLYLDLIKKWTVSLKGCVLISHSDLTSITSNRFHLAKTI
jgi:ABC-type multidrug transport system ATPase subunit